MMIKLIIALFVVSAVSAEFVRRQTGPVTTQPGVSIFSQLALIASQTLDGILASTNSFAAIMQTVTSSAAMTTVQAINGMNGALNTVAIAAKDLAGGATDIVGKKREVPVVAVPKNGIFGKAFANTLATMTQTASSLQKEALGIATHFLVGDSEAKENVPQEIEAAIVKSGGELIKELESLAKTMDDASAKPGPQATAFEEMSKVYTQAAKEIQEAVDRCTGAA